MQDPYLEALEADMDRKGYLRADLGRLLGLDSSQVTRIFGGRRRVQLHEAQKIDQWLGRSSTPAGIVLPGPGMVPLYGQVGASSASRLTLAEQNILGYVPMHPAQMGVREPFALQVADTSMVPRYEPGETVYCAPNRWPLRDQDAVLITNDSYGFLKRFLRRTNEEVLMHQLNPAKDVPFKLSDVQAIHAVVGRG